MKLVIPGFFVAILPQEIIERISPGVYFSHHLIQIRPHFVNTDLLLCGNENARSIFPCYPGMFIFLESVIFRLFRLK